MDMNALCYFRLVVEHVGDLVDYWITFNEPHVFAMLTYCAGAWPGGDPNMLETVTAAAPKGVFKVVMDAMANAHLDAYDIIHKSRCKFSSSFPFSPLKVMHPTYIRVMSKSWSQTPGELARKEFESLRVTHVFLMLKQ